MPIAAIWGTTVGYSYYHDKVIIETIDNRVVVVDQSTFDYLYCKLNNFVAALREDCIEYAVHEIDKCLLQYPKWFIDACEDGIIYGDEAGNYLIDSEKGEIVMSHNSVILRNYKGELMYLEGYKFHQYYDTLRE